MTVMTEAIREIAQISPILSDVGHGDIMESLNIMGIRPDIITHILGSNPIISEEAIIAADKLEILPYIEVAAKRWIETNGSFVPAHCIVMTIINNKDIQYYWKCAMRSACQRGDDLSIYQLWIDELKSFCITLWPHVNDIRTSAFLLKQRIPLLQHHFYRFTDDDNSSNELDVFEYLLTKNKCNEFINNLFLRSVDKGSIKASLLLLEYGANVNYKNDRGHSCLYFAAINKHYTMFSIMMKKGAVMDAATRKVLQFKRFRMMAC
tara:strand:- start:169 stop:960 length:792 start_codon:yes stop_codon:yes gene_type:complete